MVDHEKPHGEAAEGDESTGKWTEQRDEPAQHMGNDQRSEGNQRLQRMEEHEAAALLQRKKDDAADKGEEIT
ncbi:hypothetical protein D3C81_1449920 [compost metagenome]